MGKDARGKNQNKPPTLHTHTAGSTLMLCVCSRHDMSIENNEHPNVCDIFLGDVKKGFDGNIRLC